MGEEVFLTPKALGARLGSPPVSSAPVPHRTLPPDVPAAGRYEPALYAPKVECAEQAHNFGHVATVEQCDKLVSATVECGSHLMFSLSHPDWACRCCGPFGQDDGPQSDQWDVFRTQVPRLQTLPALPQSPPEVDPFDGLPVAEGARPDWLVREDQLVVDARGGKEGGILILQAVLMDVNSLWGKKQKKGHRPDWLRAILATNRAHARKHGHAMVLRAAPTQPQLTRWMAEDCGEEISRRQCTARNERENFNWEKHLMLSDYLHSPQRFSHVLMLDADAALVQPQLDTLRSIGAQLDAAGRDLFLTDEDWLDENGRGRINGGLMMAKNTPFTKQLFLDTFHAHVEGRYLREPWGIGVQGYTCTSNEQICLNDLYYGNQGKRIFTAHAILASGKQYNRGAERGGERHITDPTTEIMHWMGGSKGSAGAALCNGVRDLTFEGLSGYGCRPS